MRTPCRLILSIAATMLLLLAAATQGDPQINGPGDVAMNSHIAHAAQSVQGSVVFELMHDGPVTVTPGATGQNSQTLKNGSGDVLTTQYKLTGANLRTPDQDWVSANDFVAGRNYEVQGSGPSDVTLSVMATSAADRCNEAGAYTAQIELTVTW